MFLFLKERRKDTRVTGRGLKEGTRNGSSRLFNSVSFTLKMRASYSGGIINAEIPRHELVEIGHDTTGSAELSCIVDRKDGGRQVELRLKYDDMERDISVRRKVPSGFRCPVVYHMHIGLASLRVLDYGSAAEASCGEMRVMIRVIEE